MNEDELTEEEIEELEKLGYGFPKPDEKNNIFSFFKRVIATRDTTRVSNLQEEELGHATIPVRTNLQLALYCEQMGLGGLGSHFMKESQIISNSSLSRDGFLDKLAVTQKREMDTKTRTATPAQRRNWFQRKNQPQQEY